MRSLPVRAARSAADRHRAFWAGLLIVGTAVLVPGIGAAPDVESFGDRGNDAVLNPSDGSWTDGSCSGCHTPARGFSHPVGMRPGWALPPEFPLQSGRVTCMTCHDADSAASHARARSEGGPLLRGGLSAAELCGECHESSMGSARSAHPSALGRAHLLWEGDRPARRGSGGVAGELDEQSARCMGCHDGSLAFDAGGQRSNALSARGRELEHPVGLVYAGGRHERGGVRLAAVETLDSRIRLFDGAIGCGTCHSLFSKERAYLSMSNQASAMCLECHEDG